MSNEALYEPDWSSEQEAGDGVPFLFFLTDRFTLPRRLPPLERAGRWRRRRSGMLGMHGATRVSGTRTDQVGHPEGFSHEFHQHIRVQRLA